MKQAKIVGIFGCEQTDICIYLANILENMNYHVLVIDNSKEQATSGCIPKPNVRIPVVTYKDVDYQDKVCVKDWRAKQYDFILADLGECPSQEELSYCEERIFVTGCDYYSIRSCRKFLLGIQLPAVVVIRHYHSEMMLKKQIIRQLEEENCFVMEHYFLSHDAWDESKRVLMQYEGYKNCSDLSKEFEKLLFHLACMLGKRGYRAALSGISRAKKGECY